MAKEVLAVLKSRYQSESSTEDENTKEDSDKEHHNAVIQIQADLDKIKNTLDIKESKIYFNVLATSDSDCRSKFNLRKDRKGWYLKENADPKQKLDAIRAFGII